MNAFARLFCLFLLAAALGLPAIRVYHSTLIGISFSAPAERTDGLTQADAEMRQGLSTGARNVGIGCSEYEFLRWRTPDVLKEFIAEFNGGGWEVRDFENGSRQLDKYTSLHAGILSKAGKKIVAVIFFSPAESSLSMCREGRTTASATSTLAFLGSLERLVSAVRSHCLASAQMISEAGTLMRAAKQNNYNGARDLGYQQVARAAELEVRAESERSACEAGKNDLLDTALWIYQRSPAAGTVKSSELFSRMDFFTGIDVAFRERAIGPNSKPKGK